MTLLGTERLVLRPVGHDDLSVLHRHWTDPVVRRYLWDDEMVDQQTAAAVIEESLANFARRGFGMWSVVHAGQFVGVCGLREGPWADEVELLYSLEPRAHGRGYATEAARAVLDHACAALRLTRVHAGYDVPNLASAGVLDRLGFAPAGVPDDLAPDAPDAPVSYRVYACPGDRSR